MAWYPVGIAMSWVVCTCAETTNLLMENCSIFYVCCHRWFYYFWSCICLLPNYCPDCNKINVGAVRTWSGFIRRIWGPKTHTGFFHILLSIPHSFTRSESLWAHLCQPRFIIYLTEGLAEGIWTPHKLSCKLQCDAYQFHSLSSLAHNLSANPSRGHLQIQVETPRCN